MEHRVRLVLMLLNALYLRFHEIIWYFNGLAPGRPRWVEKVSVNVQMHGIVFSPHKLGHKRWRRWWSVWRTICYFTSFEKGDKRTKEKILWVRKIRFDGLSVCSSGLNSVAIAWSTAHSISDKDIWEKELISASISTMFRLFNNSYLVRHFAEGNSCPTEHQGLVLVSPPTPCILFCFCMGAVYHPKELGE